MRNLKRALSLALASVMLLGMMVVGTSAVSYPDVSAEDNVEAIEVLNAVEVMVGDRGNFRPDSPVNRHEMAAIMARLYLGKDAAENYVGNHPFTDVYPWADKYVAACYENGLINGTSRTTFSGNQPLTAIQAAAMMLRALGYEDLSKNATDWRTPVAAKANEIRLFKDVTSSPSAQLTRNQVAQLALNTLKADVVITSGQGGTVTTPDGTVVNLGNLKYDPVAESTYSYNDNSAGDTSNDGGTRQLIEKLYEDDLTLKVVAAGDDFGRPAHKWQYDGKDVITVADDATETYIGAVELGDIYDDLGLSSTISATVKVDGNSAANASVADGSSTEIGDDGQTVEVYYDKDASTVKIAIVSSFLGVVTDDSAKSGDKTGIRIDVSGVGSKFFETEAGYAEDDVVLLTMANGDVKEITGTPKTVTGEVTRLGSDKAMTIDGTKYPQAAQFDDADGDVIKGVANASLAVSNSYTLYLDANDCYLAAVEVEDNTSTSLVYVFDAEVADILDSSNNRVSKQVMATLVNMDGTYRDVKIELEGAETISGTTVPTRISNMKGSIVNLNHDEDEDEYTLTVLGSGDDYANAALPSTAAFELKADDRNTKFGASTVYYLNNNTVYLFVSEDDDGDIDKVEIFTGGVDASVAASTDGAIAFESNKSVGYVVIEDSFSASADDVIYITNATSKGDVKDGKLYKGYRVGTDTEEQEIAIQTGANGADVIDATGFYSYTSVRSNDNLDKLAKHASDAAGYVVDKAIASLVRGDGAFTGSANDEVYDFTKAVVVDVRDNTDIYGEINSLSALTRAFDRDYGLTVSAYINGDDEVVGLFVTDVTDPPEARTVTATAGGTVSSWTLNGTPQSGTSISAKTGDTVAITYSASIDDQWYRFADGYTSSVVAQADQAVLTFTMPAGSSAVTLERVYKIQWKANTTATNWTDYYVKNDGEVADAITGLTDQVWNGSAKVAKTAFTGTLTTNIGTSDDKQFTAMAEITITGNDTNNTVSGTGISSSTTGHAVVGATITVGIESTKTATLTGATFATGGSGATMVGSNATSGTFTMPATAVTVGIA